MERAETALILQHPASAYSSTHDSRPTLHRPSPDARNVSADEDHSFDEGTESPEDGLGFSGTVDLVTLPDLLQFLAHGRRSALLKVRHGRRIGRMWFGSGHIVHAECGKQEGENAVQEMLRWQHGSFELSAEPSLGRTTISAPLAHLLLDSLRTLDEEEHRAHSGGAEQPSGEFQPPGSPFSWTIERLSRLKGFVGAAVIDAESGGLFAASKDTQFDLVTAGAGNSRVLRAKRETLRSLSLAQSVEDILITLPLQYHLIRPCRHQDGFFLYLVLDRRSSSLALARHSLAACEAELRAE